MGVDTSQKTESLDQLVQAIEKAEVVLPEFQRDFVWEEYKTHELFDSLIRNIFVGSLIFGVPAFEITVRELDTRPRKGVGSRRKLKVHTYNKDEVNQRVKSGQFRLLLDGQQRATSLFRALRGIDPVWVILKRDDELPVGVKSRPLADRSLEDTLYEVTSKQSPDRLSILASDCFRMLRGEISRERDKAALLEASEFGQKAKFADVQASSLFDEYLHYSNQVQNLIRAEKLLSYYLLDTDEEKFSLFFERSNSLGIQLNFIDILAAKLYSGFNLRKRIEEFNDENPNHRLGQNEIVRAVAFLTSDGRDISRRYILSTLTHEHFNRHWNALCDAYRKVLNYLYDNRLLISPDWLPYESLLIPLLVFLSEVKGHDFSQINRLQAQVIQYWYWASIFSQRYSSASLEDITFDAKILRAIARGDADFDHEYFEKFQFEVNSGADLMGVSKKYNAIYRGVLNLIHWDSDGTRDWNNNDYVSFANKNLDDHHIFPRKYLSDNFPDLVSGQIDCVLNRSLVPKITNIKIGAKRPGEYLAILLRNNPKLGEALASHLIPPEVADGRYDIAFGDFLEERGRRIVAVLNEKVRPLKDLIKVGLGSQSITPAGGPAAAHQR